MLLNNTDINNKPKEITKVIIINELVEYLEDERTTGKEVIAYVNNNDYTYNTSKPNK